tara:strand:- start:1241 stop:1429 length:189 start_codon:yes stop_codon:yes gene_type:complete
MSVFSYWLNGLIENSVDSKPLLYALKYQMQQKTDEIVIPQTIKQLHLFHTNEIYQQLFEEIK